MSAELTDDEKLSILMGCKPHWQQMHEWFIEDMVFEVKQMDEFKELLKKHPEDSSGDIFRELITNVRKRLVKMKVEYEKIYYDKPEVK